MLYVAYSSKLYCADNSNGTLRLVGGTFSNEGRVEIFYGVWGTVCDDGWSLEDAIVVCRQLGWLGAVAYSGVWFGQGTGEIWLDNLGCTGRELKLEQCPHAGIGIHNCGHHEDAAVQCTSNYLFIAHS